LRVEDISNHIALDDQTAHRWVVELFGLVDSQLTTFSQSGRIVPELGAREVRELVYGAYRVFYRVGAIVEVLTVRHGSQLLREDEVGD
jgi:plasmid stabilization system protein ParE